MNTGTAVSDLRKPVNWLSGSLLLRQLRQELPEHAQRYIDPVFRGQNWDREQSPGSHLVSAAPNEFRGLIALCAYWMGTPNPIYRDIIYSAWNHDHGAVIGACRGGPPQVRRLLAAGQFDVPFDGEVNIYRGTCGISLGQANKGLSWTTKKEVARWFANRYSDLRSSPLVLEAKVDVKEIIYWCNERQEHEVVTRHCPDAKPIDVPPWKGKRSFPL